MKSRCGICGVWHRDKSDQNRVHAILKEKELLRQRAIDEVTDHHVGADRKIAALDVDMEVKRHMKGVIYYDQDL